MKSPMPNLRKSLTGINFKSLFSKNTFQAVFSRGFWRSLADTPDATRFYWLLLSLLCLPQALLSLWQKRVLMVVK
jgi:hypothetical protein